MKEKVAKLRQLNHTRGDVSKLQLLDKQFGSLLFLSLLPFWIHLLSLSYYVLFNIIYKNCKLKINMYKEINERQNGMKREQGALL